MRFFKICMALSLTVFILLINAITVSAAVSDGKIANQIGCNGVDIGEADSNGVRLEFSRENGADWPTRVGYIDPVSLDGLTIRLKNVKMSADDSCFALMLNNAPGQWTDSDGILFINYNGHQMRTKKKEKVEFGYTLTIASSTSDKSGWTYKPTLSTLSGDVTIYLHKLNKDTWEYNINGAKTEIPAKYFDAKIPNQSLAYINFGCWNSVSDVSYSVFEISNGDEPAELKAKNDNSDANSAKTESNDKSEDTAKTSSIENGKTETDNIETETVVVVDNNIPLPKNTSDGKLTSFEKKIILVVSIALGAVVIAFAALIVIILKKVKQFETQGE